MFVCVGVYGANTEIEVGHEVFFDLALDIVHSEHDARRQYDRRPAVLFETVHNEDEKQIRGLAAPEVSREVVLDYLLLAPSIRRIHEDDVELLLMCVFPDVLLQRVGMEHLGIIPIVENHVGDAQDVRKWHLVHTVDAASVGLLIGCGLDLLLQMIQRGCQESSGTAGEIGHPLA